MLAEDTRDEAYFWISRRREQEMTEELQSLKGVPTSWRPNSVGTAHSRP